MTRSAHLVRLYLTLSESARGPAGPPPIVYDDGAMVRAAGPGAAAGFGRLLMLKLVRSVLPTIVTLGLASGAALAGTQYYVRPDGVDDPDLKLCNGLHDAPPTASPNCAFRTPNFAVNLKQFRGGDDLRIAAGTYGRVRLKRLQGSASDPTVIEGDPAVARSLIRLEAGPGEDEAFYSEGGGQGGGSTGHVTLRHLTVKAGGWWGIFFDGRNESILIEDVEMGPEETAPMAPAAQCQAFPDRNCRTGRSVQRAAFIKVGEINYQSSDITIRDSRFVGSRTAAAHGIEGVDANAFFILGRARIRNVEASHFLGSFVQEFTSGSIVEDCTITDTPCDSGDGCVYSYNDIGIIVRRNLFERVRGSGQFPVIAVRRTSARTPAGGVLAYNNTILSMPDVEGFEACFSLKRGGSSSFGTGDSVFLNNIVMNGANRKRDTYAVQLNLCPADGHTVRVDHNAYFNNDEGRDFGNTAGCPGVFNAKSLHLDPRLDDRRRPPAGSPLCTGGDAAFVAPDGDRADPWIGARPC
ncbi:MAG TPA: hypothetical protein VFP98_10395, partial [Candidatus Polarisedimenticolia bacterium]|nr:hypothetical protein [Candidatus Polarisedimenticolia bacterium]